MVSIAKVRSNVIPDAKYRVDAYDDINNSRGCIHVACSTFSEVLKFVLWRGNPTQRRVSEAQIIEGLNTMRIVDNPLPYAVLQANTATSQARGRMRAPARVVYMHQSVSEAPRATTHVQAAGQGHLPSYTHASESIVR